MMRKQTCDNVNYKTYATASAVRMQSSSAVPESIASITGYREVIYSLPNIVLIKPEHKESAE